jgi:hypothetical protein
LEKENYMKNNKTKAIGKKTSEMRKNKIGMAPVAL